MHTVRRAETDPRRWCPEGKFETGFPSIHRNASDAHPSDDDLTRILHRMLPIYFADYLGMQDTLDPLFAAMTLCGGPIQGANRPHLTSRSSSPRSPFPRSCSLAGMTLSAPCAGRRRGFPDRN